MMIRPSMPSPPVSILLRKTAWLVLFVTEIWP
jgi:hypothetical protein